MASALLSREAMFSKHYDTFSQPESGDMQTPRPVLGIFRMKMQDTHFDTFFWGVGRVSTFQFM